MKYIVARYRFKTETVAFVTLDEEKAIALLVLMLDHWLPWSCANQPPNFTLRFHHVGHANCVLPTTLDAWKASLWFPAKLSGGLTAIDLTPELFVKVRNFVRFAKHNKSDITVES